MRRGQEACSRIIEFNTMIEIPSLGSGSAEASFQSVGEQDFSSSEDLSESASSENDTCFLLVLYIDRSEVIVEGIKFPLYKGRIFTYDEAKEAYRKLLNRTRKKE